MEKQTAIKLMLFGIVLLASLSAVNAQRRGEEECIAPPSEGLSIGSISDGFSFIMAGGMSTILILAIAFILGMIVSHLIWGGF
jgi:hypothetical protein